MEIKKSEEFPVLELKGGGKLPDNYTGIVECLNGIKEWYLNGLLHREDGPAWEASDGSKEWYLNGKRHREDGPACEFADGTKYWFLNGKCYSKAEWKIAVEKLKKEKEEANKSEPQVLELKSGEGPPNNYTGIVKWNNGTKKWFLNGNYHREDGPAIERADGSKYWYLNDESYFEADWKNAVEKLKKEKEEANKPDPQVLELKGGEKTPDNYTGIIKWFDGSKFWYLNGKYHRVDGPAVEFADGEKRWWLNGERHREDGPAIERVDGSKEWYLNGELHREDGPAIERADGSKQWYLNDKLHRKDGPAIERADGLNYWYLNGKECASEAEWKVAMEKLKKPELQMLELKAGEQVPNNYTGIIKWNDSDKWWYLNGKFHREDGPAIEWADGRKEWWLNGEKCSEETWNKLVNNSVKPQPESKKEEEKPQMSRFKSDMRQAGIRIACRQSVSVVRDTLVSILSAGKTKSEAKRIRDGISSLFDTEVGRGMIGYLMGSMLPMVKEHFPEKYQSITEELANEFRIEGMSVVGGEAFKFVLPFLGMAKEGMVSAMSSLVADDSPPTRVDIPNAAPKVLDDADDMPSIENQKEELKRSK